MTTSRRILLTAAVALAGLGVAAPANGAGATPSPSGAAHVGLSVEQDAAARRPCRWVPSKGVVCETETGTIGL